MCGILATFRVRAGISLPVVWIENSDLARADENPTSTTVFLLYWAMPRTCNPSLILVVLTSHFSDQGEIVHSKFCVVDLLRTHPWLCDGFSECRIPRGLAPRPPVVSVSTFGNRLLLQSLHIFLDRSVLSRSLLCTGVENAFSSGHFI